MTRTPRRAQADSKPRPSTWDEYEKALVLDWRDAHLDYDARISFENGVKVVFDTLREEMPSYLACLNADDMVAAITQLLESGHLSDSAYFTTMFTALRCKALGIKTLREGRVK